MTQGDINYCERCGEKLNPKKIKWLELNCVTGEWTDPDVTKVPEEESQGGFPFGIACAKQVLKTGQLVRIRNGQM